MSFVDFVALKEQVSFEAAIDLLDLKLKRSGNQWRGPCPACIRAGDRALVVTEGRGFYCWGVKAGGDQIALAVHVLALTAKEAANELANRAGISGNSTSDRTSSRNSSPEREGDQTKKLEPLSYLEPDHDAVAAIGFDVEFCKRHGIGYAGKGLMRGTVALPFRDEHGTLLGYIGVEQDCRIPPDFTTNVVRLKRA